MKTIKVSFPNSNAGAVTWHGQKVTDPSKTYDFNLDTDRLPRAQAILFHDVPADGISIKVESFQAFGYFIDTGDRRMKPFNASLSEHADDAMTPWISSQHVTQDSNILQYADGTEHYENQTPPKGRYPMTKGSTHYLRLWGTPLIGVKQG